MTRTRLSVVHDDRLYEVKARVATALSNPRRVQIVDLLERGERRVTDLAAALRIPQAATSQHLAVLRGAGIVEARKEGNSVYYRLTTPKIAEACNVISQAVKDLLLLEQRRLRPILEATFPSAGGGS